jgi:protein-S-isoprenylcysteine O-methyltransferase Ste14
MMKYIVLTLLAILTVASAVLEGLFDSLPPQFIQLVGLLTILCTGVFIGWMLRLQVRNFKKD